MDKPRVDEIRGIPPAIAIEQSNPVKSSRSTVGTMTEINDYLKLLWPRIARAFCPSCGREIRPETAKSITDEVMQLFALSPCHSGRSEAKRNAVEDPVAASGGKKKKSTRLSTAVAAATSAQDDRTVLITFWVSVPPK